MCKYSDNEQSVTGETQANIADAAAPFYKTVNVGDYVKGRDFAGFEYAGRVFDIDEYHDTERLAVEHPNGDWNWLVNDSVEPADAPAEAVSAE